MSFMVFFLTLEMAFFRSCKNQLSGWIFPHFRMSAWHGESCESHEGGSCWFWNSYPFLHMTESQRGSAITHGSLVRFIFHTFSLIPLTCSSVERLDGLALIQEIQEIQEIDSNICQVLDIPITTTHTHTELVSNHSKNQKTKGKKNLPVDSWTFLWISSSDSMVEEKECLLGLSLPWSILLYSSFQQRHNYPLMGQKHPPLTRSQISSQIKATTKSSPTKGYKWL